MLMSVIRTGRAFMLRVPIFISASGDPRSATGPKETPCMSFKPERKLYAAMKNGIWRKSDTDSLNTLVTL